MNTSRACSEVWVEGISAYLPHHYLCHDDLAVRTGTDPEKYARGLGCTSMAVLHPMQDSVTMAAEAGLSLLTSYGVDPASVGQLIVGTESGVDWAKPVAAYVHEMIGLSPRCRTYDVQHACYGASAALSSVGAWIASGMAAGRKALVIATDVARYDDGSPGEATQGAGAVAMLVGDSHTGVLRPDLGMEAVYSSQVMDFWRPGHRSTAVVKGKYSINCYLAALAQTYQVHREAGGEGIDELDYLLFHLPFPRMSEKALGKLMEAECGQVDEETFSKVLREKVNPGVEAARIVGNIYSGSLYLALASLLENRGARCTGRRVGLFSYGSGCCAEFFTATIGDSNECWKGRTGVERTSTSSTRIGVETYAAFRRETSRLNSDDSFKLGHMPCADSVPPDARYVYLGYRNQKRVYAPGPAGRIARVGSQVGRVSRSVPQPVGPTT
ncbi:MAG: hydroxymethylglutaryl-CoA synthase [Deltaproteobacteria bacterium]|nr:hydroxymethylglutaryl-CoA synthase [Deltaproteobacteria bacterium]